ncbi:hypothetical protein [Companilactobacillus baiquanensis]|uniref:Uncharacterized protein n=1 Tax=Companilactobacillus baiquanensis TaxID=2486005 RepID=A0ABW1UUI7_9LACO|nr:hypothetical protein [Companilactobacillus baiquanensis]
MSLFNQFSISISLIILATTIIVGTILITTNLFRISKSLKKHNELIQNSERPYLNCTLSKKHLIIKNSGNSQAEIDSIVIDENELPDLPSISINPKEIYSLKIESVKKISIKYHTDHGEYQDDTLITGN